MMKLQDKVAIVTGASEGIGAAIAREFVAEGAKVALAARSKDKLEALAGELATENTLVVPTDVTDDGQVRQMVTATVERFGRIDILVNNAGLGVLASVEKTTPDANQHMWNVNYFGVIRCVQAALPELRKTKGLIVNVSSVAGKMAMPFLGNYCGTKHALNGLSNALRMELMNEDEGVGVLLVCPGYVDTGFVGNVGQMAKDVPQRAQQPPRGISAKRLARAIVKGIVKRKHEIVVPAYLRIGVFMRNLFPRFTDRTMARFIR